MAGQSLVSPFPSLTNIARVSLSHPRRRGFDLTLFWSIGKATTSPVQTYRGQDCSHLSFLFLTCRKDLCRCTENILTMDIVKKLINQRISNPS